MTPAVLLLKLTLDVITGQPLAIETVGAPWSTVEDCERFRRDMGPQKPVDGKVYVYSCAVPKEVTRL